MSQASAHIISVFKVNSCPWHITLVCFLVCFNVQALHRSITALGFTAVTFFSITHKLHTSHTYIHYNGSEPAFQPSKLDNSWRAERSSKSIKYPSYTFQKQVLSVCLMNDTSRLLPQRISWICSGDVSGLLFNIDYGLLHWQWFPLEHKADCWHSLYQARQSPTFLWCSCWHLYTLMSTPPTPHHPPLASDLFIEGIWSCLNESHRTCPLKEGRCLSCRYSHSP